MQILILLDATDRASGKIAAVTQQTERLGQVANASADQVDEANARMAGGYDATGRSAEAAAAKQGAAADAIGAKSKAAADKTTAAADASNKSLTRFGNWGTAAVVGFAAGAVDLGIKFEQATTKIAKSADISTAKAQAIGNAMVNTAGQTEFSAMEQANAYAQVAGQLGLVEGHALTTAQAMSVTQAAMTLAEASGTDLGSAMTATAKIMQAYQVNAAHASDVTTVLENTSRVTGNSIGNVANTLQRLKTQMGVLAPPIGETSALLVDLAAHGETGRGAISSLNSAMTSLTKPLTSVAVAQDKANTAAKQLPPSLQALSANMKTAQEDAATYQAQIKALPLAQQQMVMAAAGTGTSAAKALATLPPSLRDLSAAYQKANGDQALYAAQVKALPVDQQTLMKSFTAAEAKITTARQALAALPITIADAKGNFVGLGSVIAQLGPQLKGLSETQQLAKLQEVFGAGASRKLLEVVLAGPEAFAKYKKGVEDKAAAETAAAKQSQTFEARMKTLRATGEDLGIKLGDAIIPKVELLTVDLDKGVVFLEKHKAAAQALAVVIGGVLAAAVAVFAEQKLVNLGKGLGKIVGDMGKFAETAKKAASAINGFGMANDKTALQSEAAGRAIQGQTAQTEGLGGAAGRAGAGGTAGLPGAAGAAGAAAPAGGAEALTEAAVTAGQTLEEAAATAGDTLKLAADSMATTLKESAAATTAAAESDVSTESSAVESDAVDFSGAVDDSALVFAEAVDKAAAKMALVGETRGLPGGGPVSTAEREATTAAEGAGGAAAAAKLGSKYIRGTASDALTIGRKEAASLFKSTGDPFYDLPAVQDLGLLGRGGVLGSGLSVGGAALGAVAAPLAGYTAYTQAGQFLRSKSGLGHTVGQGILGGYEGIQSFFGAGTPTSTGQAATRETIGSAPGTIKYLESLALGLQKSPGTSAGQARSMLHDTGVSDKAIAASKDSVIKTLGPAARLTDTAANNLQIAADKQLLWVDKASGVNTAGSRAAEKQLQANITSLQAANSQLASAGQSKTAATVQHQAATAHKAAVETSAQLQAKADADTHKSARDVSQAGQDMQKAAAAQVAGNTTTANMWESKAKSLDTASTNLSNAAALLSAAALTAPRTYVGMNAPPPKKHAAGGVTTGPSVGMIGEAGPEAIVPLSSPLAVEPFAKALASVMAKDKGYSYAGVPSNIGTWQGGVQYGPIPAGPTWGAHPAPTPLPPNWGSGPPASQTTSHQTIYQIQNLTVVSNNPAEMQHKLSQAARIHALSSRPMGSANLAVAT